MRKHEPIWIQLKSNIGVPTELMAPTHLHQRILNAVRKEKAKDIEWKFVQLEMRKSYTVSAISEGDKLTLQLVPTRRHYYTLN